MDSIYPKFPFDPARDLAAVAQISEHKYILVSHRSIPASTIPELVALARKSPGKLNITDRPGETWFEPAGIVRPFAENPAAEPAQLLPLFVTDEDCGRLVVMEPLQ